MHNKIHKMKQKDIDILELFSGIGGFSKGFIDAGYTIKNHSFSEIDKHAIANYKYNFKDAESIGSVTDVRGLKTPDVLTFGSPCQDFSLAGKRMGMEGQRSSLITEAIRLITELRPAVFIWENVKGTFSSNDGQDFWAIIAAFANIGGYRLEWQLLNTSWFLPQNRERIYLIGHLDGRSKPGVFPIRENGELFNNKRQIGMNVIANLNSSQDGQVFDTNGISQTLSAGHVNVPKIAACLTGGGHSGGLHSDMTTIKVNSATKDGYEIANEGDSINFSNPNSETRRGRVGKGVAQTLDTACNQGVISVATPGRKEKNQNGSRFKEDDMFCLTAEPHGVMMEIANCLTPDAYLATGERKRDENGKAVLTSMHERRIRRLTEIECERLQGFPDDWTKYGIYEKKICTDPIKGTFKIEKELRYIPKTQRYKMCGNAVTVAVVKAIAERLCIGKLESW
jgi:DNA (cytosine-5)-methyltransferase 1